MKRVMTISITVVLALASLGLLSGCATNYTGKWALTYVDDGSGTLQTVDDYFADYASYFDIDDMMNITFKSDGTAAVVSMGEKTSYEWTDTGSGVKLTSAWGSSTLSYETVAKCLVLENNGVRMVFQKA